MTLAKQSTQIRKHQLLISISINLLIFFSKIFSTLLCKCITFSNYLQNFSWSLHQSINLNWNALQPTR